MPRRPPWPRSAVPHRCLPGAAPGRSCRLGQLPSEQPSQSGSAPANLTRATGPRRIAAEHWIQGSRVVVRTSRLCWRKLSRARTLTSAWAREEPNTSPGGPCRSATRLRAACTRVPSGSAAHAPTAMLPVRSASQAWRNASCQPASRPAQSVSAVTCGLSVASPSGVRQEHSPATRSSKGLDPRGSLCGEDSHRA